MKGRLTPYGMSNFESIILDNRYFVDKTKYIEELERTKNPIFLRPRRFGKSLFTEILRWYYDLRRRDSFERLFGNLYIGKNPTPLHNTYYFLALDFSGMGAWVEGDKNFIKKEFDNSILIDLHYFLKHYQDLLKLDDNYINNFRTVYQNDAASGLKEITKQVYNQSGKMFIAIDEYDSLTNAMAIYYQYAPEADNEYLNILRKGGFFRGFFESIKAGTKICIDQVYITGILPITIADMNSGYNIAEWITFNRNFVNMLGITESELDKLLDEVYADYPITILTKAQTQKVLKQYYDGYRFSANAENVYNPMMTMYFIKHLIQNDIPDLMADRNLRIEYNQLAYIFGNNTEERNKVISTITDTKTFKHDQTIDVSFDMNAYKEVNILPKGCFIPAF